MFFSAALVLSVAASALASTPFERGHSGHTKKSPKLYARAFVHNPANGVQAKFEMTGTMDGEPTFVKISGIKGLTNAMGVGPYGYHIHTNPVPADGNCTKTLAHLDPLSATPSFVCNPAFPEYCEIGDLSGKHGKFNGTSNGKIAAFGYSDAYIRFFPQELSLLGRSIVIHAANTTRLACGNITSHLDGTADSHWEPTYKPSTYVKDYPTAAPKPPGPAVVPFNGTQFPDQSVFAALPYPWPIAALPLSEAQNVKLTNVTHSVKFANSEQTITQPKLEKVDGTGPFKGKWDSNW